MIAAPIGGATADDAAVAAIHVPTWPGTNGPTVAAKVAMIAGVALETINLQPNAVAEAAVRPVKMAVGPPEVATTPRMDALTVLLARPQTTSVIASAVCGTAHTNTRTSDLIRFLKVPPHLRGKIITGGLWNVNRTSRPQPDAGAINKSRQQQGSGHGTSLELETGRDRTRRGAVDNRPSACRPAQPGTGSPPEPDASWRWRPSRPRCSATARQHRPGSRTGDEIRVHSLVVGTNPRSARAKTSGAPSRPCGRQRRRTNATALARIIHEGS